MCLLFQIPCSPTPAGSTPSSCLSTTWAATWSLRPPRAASCPDLTGIERFTLWSSRLQTPAGELAGAEKARRHWFILEVRDGLTHRCRSLFWMETDVRGDGGKRTFSQRCAFEKHISKLGLRSSCFARSFPLSRSLSEVIVLYKQNTTESCVSLHSYLGCYACACFFSRTFSR